MLYWPLSPEVFTIADGHKTRVPVDGPAACLKFVRSSPYITRQTAGIVNLQQSAECVSADGTVQVLIKQGQPMIPKAATGPK